MKQYIQLLRQRNFSLLAASDGISVLGDQIGWIALLWFVMVTTGHSLDMGWLALSYGLPTVLFAPVAGNLMDRYARKPLSIAAYLLLGLVFTAIPTLYWSHALSFPVLLVLTVAAGALVPFTNVGWMVMLSSTVAERDLSLANSLSETIYHIASMLGPPLGGVLIATINAPAAMAVDGVSFLLAALCIGLVRDDSDPARSATSERTHTRLSFWRDVWTGIHYLYTNRTLWWLTLGAALFNVAYGQLEVSLPLFVHHQLATTAVVLGSLWTVYFVGAVLGSAASGLLAPHGRQGLLMAGMLLGWGLSLLPMLWFHTVWAAYVSMALAGCLFAGYPPISRTAVQQLVPTHLQGRIFGLRGSIITLGIPVGSYLSGALAQVLRPSALIGYTGLAMIFVALFLASRPSFRSV